MPVVDIGGTDYEVYDEQADVTSYLAASIGASLWAALPATTGQRQCMVSAARMFDRTIWDGDKTSDVQPIAHPRTGLTDRDGDAVSSVVIHPDVLAAFAELCEELAGDADTVQDSATTGTMAAPVCCRRSQTAASATVITLHSTETARKSGNWGAPTRAAAGA